MLNQGDFKKIAEACNSIGNEIADDSGFIPVQRLLDRFQARLIIRPLLVEGMLASTVVTDANATQWAVLVDKETYRIDDAALMNENRNQPLSIRLRNTIAHELAHSLAFRPTEFGVRFDYLIDDENNRTELVKIIEKETEQFSPFLLFSERALERLLKGRKGPLSIADVAHTRYSAGVSRYLFINRLRLLRSLDKSGLLNSPGLRNFAVGIAKWADGKRAILKSWPLFTNFERNILPSFFFTLAKHTSLAAIDLFPDESFAMCGGENETTVFTSDAGVENTPAVEKMCIEVMIESSNRRSGEEFFYIVRKQGPLIEL